MRMLPIRLTPGQDLRLALQAAVAAQRCGGAFVVSGIGSLTGAQLRLAGIERPRELHGDLEVLTLSGTVTATTSHLHATIADAHGTVLGGHVGPGCAVRTTAEVLLSLVDDWTLSREPDAVTGYDELVVRGRTA